MNLIDLQYLVLASKSPRRKDLLEQLGIPIKINPSDVDETKIALGSPKKYAAKLSELKARTTAQQDRSSWVLGADTIVVINDEILGKPRSEGHALDMLKKLNNERHTVYTAFCLTNHYLNRSITRVVDTRVQFKLCTKAELMWYIGTNEPFGKAGAYAIQGKGGFMVKSISGSYSNVVGLPICEVVEEMKNLNLIKF